MYGVDEVFQRRMAKYVLTNHLASDVKAVWRTMPSSNAASECASCSLNMLMTLK